MHSFFSAARNVLNANGYVKVSHNEEGYIALEGEEAAALLDDTHLPTISNRPSTRCGPSRRWTWKAAGLVFSGVAIYYFLRLAFWAVALDEGGIMPEPPVYGSFPSCGRDGERENEKEIEVRVPMGPKWDHAFDMRGSAMGTFVIAEASDPESDEVLYEIKLWSPNRDLVDQVSLSSSKAEEDEKALNSHLLISIPPKEDCMRYEIWMYIPKRLQKLHVAAHSLAHVRFDEGSDIALEELYVTLYTMDRENMVALEETVKAKKLAVEVYRGWIVGDVSLLKRTSMSTQRGDGIMDVRVHPIIGNEPNKMMELQTTSGAGRSQVAYVERSKERMAVVESRHVSSRPQGKLYLRYADSFFHGEVQVAAESLVITGARQVTTDASDTVTRYHVGVDDAEPRDRMYVQTRGWAGVYFE